MESPIKTDEYTVQELKDHLREHGGDYSADELDAALHYEDNHDGRSTAMDAIQDATGMDPEDDEDDVTTATEDQEGATPEDAVGDDTQATEDAQEGDARDADTLPLDPEEDDPGDSAVDPDAATNENADAHSERVGNDVAPRDDDDVGGRRGDTEVQPQQELRPDNEVVNRDPSENPPMVVVDPLGNNYAAGHWFDDAGVPALVPYERRFDIRDDVEILERVEQSSLWPSESGLTLRPSVYRDITSRYGGIQVSDRIDYAEHEHED